MVAVTFIVDVDWQHQLLAYVITVKFDCLEILNVQAI